MKIGHLFTPRMRPQAIDVQAAVIWGVAAGTTALWLIQHDRLLLAWGRMCNALGQCCGLSAVLGFCLGQCCGLSGLLNHESNPDMLLAVRALTHLCDVLPSSRAAVVHHGAISCFVARLVTIEYMDLAEQSLQALKKIAQEHPTACLRAGALMAVLSYLDFFSTGVQRIALSTATNMCKKLPSDAADFVMEVVPLLTNLLQYHDAKVLEHTSVCLTRIAEAFASTPDKLDELCNHGLVMQTATLRRRSLIRGHFFLEIIKGNFKFCTKILL